MGVEVTRLEDLPRIVRRGRQDRDTPPTGPVLSRCRATSSMPKPASSSGVRPVDTRVKPSDEALQALWRASSKPNGRHHHRRRDRQERCVREAAQLAETLGALRLSCVDAYGAHFLSESRASWRVCRA